MKKYRRLFLNFVQATLAYRWSFVMELFARSLGFLVMIYLWKAVYAQTGAIKGFTFQEILTYFLLVEVLRNLLEAKTFMEIKEAVQDGKIANYLLLPINSLYLFFARTITRSLISIGFFLVPLIIILLTTHIFIGPASIWYLLMAVGMTLIAVAMSLLIYTLFGSIAFWTVETSNIVWALNFIIMFIAGKLVPVQFMPEMMRNIIDYTPFVSIFNLPVSLYLGKFSYEVALRHFIVQAIWLVILYLFLRWVWNKGLRRLEVVGG